MPIYEYVCQSCQRKTEVIQRVKKLLKICPHCGGKLKKSFSAPAIQFKGSGWYITDYARAKKEEKGTPAASEKSEAGEKAAEAKAKAEEGKPAEAKAAEGKSAEAKKESKKKKVSDAE